MRVADEIQPGFEAAFHPGRSRGRRRKRAASRPCRLTRGRREPFPRHDPRTRLCRHDADRAASGGSCGAGRRSAGADPCARARPVGLTPPGRLMPAVALWSRAGRRQPVALWSRAGRRLSRWRSGRGPAVSPGRVRCGAGGRIGRRRGDGCSRGASPAGAVTPSGAEPKEPAAARGTTHRRSRAWRPPRRGLTEGAAEDENVLIDRGAPEHALAFLGRAGSRRAGIPSLLAEPVHQLTASAWAKRSDAVLMPRAFSPRAGRERPCILKLHR